MTFGPHRKSEKTYLAYTRADVSFRQVPGAGDNDASIESWQGSIFSRAHEGPACRDPFGKRIALSWKQSVLMALPALFL